MTKWGTNVGPPITTNNVVAYDVVTMFQNKQLVNGLKLDIKKLFNAEWSPQNPKGQPVFTKNKVWKIRQTKKATIPKRFLNEFERT